MPQPQLTRQDARTSRSSQGMVLTSPAFADGATIPVRYTADGKDVSPPLTWSRGLEGTESFALVCDDPDAPSGLFTHWLVWAIGAGQLGLDEAMPKDLETHGVRQGLNGFGRAGWGGPSPPRGKPHRYLFHLYALDTALDLRAGASRADFDRAIEAHVLGEVILIGMYGR